MASFSLKAGKVYSDYRIYGKYTDIDDDSDSFTALTAHYDRFLSIDEKVKLFIGGAFGYVSSKLDDDIDVSGLTYGITLGVIVEITEQASIEIGYDYMLSNASDTLDIYDDIIYYDIYDIKLESELKLELDKYDNLHIGINIKF